MSAGTNGTTDTMDEEARRRYIDKQQRWLLFLRHCAKCRATEDACRFGRSCTVVKELWEHVLRCGAVACAYPRCVATKDLLSHHQRCRDAACPICAPVRDHVWRASSEARAQQLLAEIEAERQAEIERRERRRVRRRRARQRRRTTITTSDDEDDEEEEREDECVVCLDAVPNMCLVPCGHRILCGPCADLLMARDRDRETTCPVCRGRVEAAVAVTPVSSSSTSSGLRRRP